MWNRLIPLARSPIGDSMADPRIIDVQLDERTILWRSADVEQERRIASYEMLEGNHVAPRRPQAEGYDGPYRTEERRVGRGCVRTGRKGGWTEEEEKQEQEKEDD